MKRRNFLKSSLAVAGVAGATTLSHMASAAEKKNPSGREYYELRRYLLRRGPKTKLVEDFWRDVSLPALKRAGVGPVGVFNVMVGPDSPTLYVLLTHNSVDSMTTLGARLDADGKYKKASADFFAAPATDPAYIRLESSLMLSLEGIPKLEVPENKARMFELRTYESHNERAARKKIEMFNTGEIGIFRRCGLQPVFFGETLLGAKMPNLTYMLVFENMAAREKNWATF